MYNCISWTDLESVESPHSNKQQTENTLKSEEPYTSHIKIAKNVRVAGAAHRGWPIIVYGFGIFKSPHSNKQQTEKL